MSALFHENRKTTVDVDEQLLAALDAGYPLIYNLSGGKDSHALAFAVNRFLKKNGYTNQVFAIHSNLGNIEWRESGPQCTAIADALGIELMTVHGIYGGLLDHWEQRDIRNWTRFRDLLLTSMITPFSLPAWRTCTKETKSIPIEKELRRRFGGPCISVVGIRRQESSNRAKAPICAPYSSGSLAGSLTWHPIATWSVEDVWNEIRSSGVAPHHAYLLGNERVSCSFCIMASLNDLMVALDQEQHWETYRWIVGMEQKSLHSFQPGRWLMQMRPDLLLPDQRAKIDSTIEKASRLKQLQADIPTSIRLDRGKPVTIPEIEDARLYADIRRAIFDLFGEPSANSDPNIIRNLYIQRLDPNLSATRKTKATQSSLFDMTSITA